MKIRTGFVSNSSSSSFCIFGFHLKKTSEEIAKLFNIELEHDNDVYELMEIIFRGEDIGWSAIFDEYNTGDWIVGFDSSENTFEEIKNGMEKALQNEKMKALADGCEFRLLTGEYPC